MNIITLQQRLGGVRLGQLKHGYDLIDLLNEILDEGAKVDEHTDGTVLAELYSNASPTLKQQLKELTLFDQNTFLTTLEDIDRVKINDQIIQDKDDTIKDVFMVGFVLVCLVIVCMLTFSYVKVTGYDQAINKSETVRIMVALADVLKHLLPSVEESN